MSVIPFPAPAVLNDLQARRNALDVRRSFIVEAPAGSGKTGLLIQRYLKLLAIVDQPESVLALTFTNKAAGEMRQRVLSALDSAQQPLADAASDFARETWAAARAVQQQDTARGWNLRAQPYRLNLRTIDSLCGEIARAVPVLSGGIGQATPVPEAMPLYRAAAHSVLMRLGGTDEPLNRALEDVLLHRDGDLADCEKLLAEMLGTREQWAQLVPLGRDLLDDAALDRDVRPRLDAALESVLCEAITQVKQRFPPALLQHVALVAHMVASALPDNGTGHALARCAQLPHAPGAAADDLHHWQMLSQLLLTEAGTWRKPRGITKATFGYPLPPQLRAQLLDALQEMEPEDDLLALLCGLRDLPPAQYPDDQWATAKSLFRLLYHALIELKLLFAQREVCDFTELSLAARSALHAGDADRLGMRLEHLLVDEMQDTSSAQYELLQLLTSGWNGTDQTVFLVGDPKQSIYLFRQARVERFLAGMRHGKLGDIPVEPLRLTSNFRSGAGLVHAFNDTFSAVFADADEIRYTAASAALPTTAADLLVWHATPQDLVSGIAGKAAETARVHREEAEAVAAFAWDWKAGNPSRSAAILVRSRSHALQVMRKLADAAVPFRAVAMQTLAERPEVLDALAITRALLHPADRTAWLAVLRAPWCGLTLHDLHTLAAGDNKDSRKQALRLHLRQRAPLLAPDARQRLLRTLNVLDRAIDGRGRAALSVDVDRTWHALQGDCCTDADGKRNVRAYLELLERMEAAGETVDAPTLRDRLTGLYAETDTAPGAIEILTIHKAKGLEWDAVLVPGLHRIAQADKAPLLDWMELPHPDAKGQPQVLLAPIAKRGDQPGSLNRYLRKARTAAREAELQRLFYVAGTRARTSLQLFASPARKVDGTLSVRAGTLLNAAWRAAEPHFHAQEPHVHAQEPHVPAQAQAAPPALPLPLEGLALAAQGSEDGAAAQQPAPLRRLPLQQIQAPLPPPLPELRPAAQALDTFSRPTGSLAARMLGNTVHAFLQHLADVHSTGDIAPVDIDTYGRRIRALARTGGLSPRDTDHVCQQTLRALQQTLNHAEGRWLLAPHTRAVNEGELFGRPDKGNQHARIERYRFDRSFFAGPAPFAPGTAVLWIVDYKTATRRGAEAPGAVREQFLQEEREHYRAHLRNYARLALETLPSHTPVMLALYHPLLPHLDFWQYEPDLNES